MRSLPNGEHRRNGVDLIDGQGYACRCLPTVQVTDDSKQTSRSEQTTGLAARR
ncbi:hypothetical protein Pan14r_36160 [Crateriforma conspicua]|uniref:Uncharacterized protein n=1 Tax=Crateriforma conspicua TaxID=2527996 RepID=A0A5C5Y6P3_9PLAN|nr:hypothetical protein Mal65_50820 [Crateriforma conspicua]TWT71306.1 hypothetical protein Pan14r_36160 [Crateriforma conspicua]